MYRIPPITKRKNLVFGLPGFDFHDFLASTPLDDPILDTSLGTQHGDVFQTFPEEISKVETFRKKKQKNNEKQKAKNPWNPMVLVNKWILSVRFWWSFGKKCEISMSQVDCFRPEATVAAFSCWKSMFFDFDNFAESSPEFCWICWANVCFFFLHFSRRKKKVVPMKCDILLLVQKSG